MERTLTIGRLFDIRVGVHVSWIFVYLFMTTSIAGGIDDIGRIAAFALAAVCALGIFLSVVAHEFAHALVARRFGVRTSAITLFLFGGVATLESEPPTPRAETMIALAGPLASALLGGIAFGLFSLDGHFVRGPLAAMIDPLALYLTAANLGLAVFNMIPAFPMDGGRVLRAALWRMRGSQTSATASASVVGLVFASMLATSGIGLGIWMRTWQAGWYVVLASFVARQAWMQLREARLMQRLEAVCVVDMMDAASGEDVVFDGFSLAPTANALEALAAFRASDRTMIPVIGDGRLWGWLGRDRTLAALGT